MWGGTQQRQEKKSGSFGVLFSGVGVGRSIIPLSLSFCLWESADIRGRYWLKKDRNAFGNPKQGEAREQPRWTNNL